MAGAMAGGIASADMVIALAKEGFLASFGAAGLLPEHIEKALTRFAAEIPGLPFAVNLIHSPSEDRLEREAVELFLRHGVRCVEASAYMDLTPHVVRYRLAGLRRDVDGRVVADNRLIAKISRTETASLFMRPAPAALVNALVQQGLVTSEQAELSRHLPLADDITVEADSGGHTDRRPLPALLPTILRLRDTMQREYHYATAIRVGAGGGLGTPVAIAAAYAMGAAYAVTGSVNQSCLESGASTAAKAMLAEAGIADCEMAPAADMFEMGVDLQVLKKGTFFPMRAHAAVRAVPGVRRAGVDPRGRPDQAGDAGLPPSPGGRLAGVRQLLLAPRPGAAGARGRRTPSAGWPWSSGGTWGWPRAGRSPVTRTAPWTTRSGAVRRWAPSTTG